MDFASYFFFAVFFFTLGKRDNGKSKRRRRRWRIFLKREFSYSFLLECFVSVCRLNSFNGLCVCVFACEWMMMCEGERCCDIQNNQFTITFAALSFCTQQTWFCFLFVFTQQMGRDFTFFLSFNKCCCFNLFCVCLSSNSQTFSIIYLICKRRRQEFVPMTDEVMSLDTIDKTKGRYRNDVDG